MTKDKYSVAILACGDLLDTLAAIRAGLLPIWGSDTCSLSQKLWKDLVRRQYILRRRIQNRHTVNKETKNIKISLSMSELQWTWRRIRRRRQNRMDVREASRHHITGRTRRNNNRTDRQRNKHKQRQRSQQEPEAGCIHHIGNYGEGAGNYQYPHPLQSWWGLP